MLKNENKKLKVICLLFFIHEGYLPISERECKYDKEVKNGKHTININ